MSVPRFDIRAATKADVSIILSFIKKLADYERLSHEVVASEETLRETLFGRRRTAEVAIGYLKESQSASCFTFTIIRHFSGVRVSTSRICLSMKRFAGCGFGAALLRYVAGVAKQRRCGRLEWSVLDWNEPAINFYKKLGALPMSEWTVFRVTGKEMKKLAEG